MLASGAVDLTGPHDATRGEGTEHPARLAPARLVVAGPPGARHLAPTTGLAVTESAVVERPTGIRRRLILDAAIVLGASAAIVIAVSIVSPAGPTGGVLGITTDGMATAGTIVGPGPGASTIGATHAPRATPSAVSAPASLSSAATASATVGPGAASAPTGASAPSVPPLVPCPDRSGCYLYLVRRGDNLTRIAARFGVAASTILAMNPSVVDPSIIVTGSTLRIPTPTR